MTTAQVSAITNVVSGLKGVSVKATYNGGNLSTTTTLNPIPTVTIVAADYDPVTMSANLSLTANFK